MRIVKFGGTSLGSATSIASALKLIVAENPVVVVVSAIGKTTDQILLAAERAEAGDGDRCESLVQGIRRTHVEIASALCDDQALVTELEDLFAECLSVLKGVTLLREQSSRSRALLLSFGERLSASIVAAALRSEKKQAEAVDARLMILTNADHEAAIVDRPASRQRIQARLQPMVDAGRIPVVTGFIAATTTGATTTLGRSGSDYSATLIGAALGASEIAIYTDVDGILSADPRWVSEARSLPHVSYREAAEMSFFGARVLHPRTITPAADARIPVRVLSAKNPEHPGTLITDEAPTLPLGVKTVTSVSEQALVTIEGRGMAGLPGVARRILEAAELAGVNIVMIAQASSEQSISLVVAAVEADGLVRALEERFAPEIARGAIERIAIETAVSVVSIIGQGMAGSPGIAGRFFGALGDALVNVLAIAQGGSELSISVAVQQKDTRRAVRAAHTAFGLTRVLNIFLLGAGRVGKTFLRMLAETRRRMEDELDLELRLVGVATSTKLILDTDGLRPAEVSDQLERGEKRPCDATLITRLAEQRFTQLVIVDATAAETTLFHIQALKARFHVVTANKVPVSGPTRLYQDLRRAGRASGARYHYETTFGAGLPLLHALQELIHTGDQPLRVSGCLSGTLGFICSCLDDGSTLAAAVAEAARLGYTEPDPREDLSGRDVARKALIIARACGLDMEPEAVELAPLVPGLEAGLDRACANFQAELSAQITAANKEGKVMRYVASIGPNEVKVGLEAVSMKTPVGSLRGPDNIVVFQTRRYHDYPLVIQGPGAGAEVTAAGVLGDVLKIAGTAPANHDFGRS